MRILALDLAASCGWACGSGADKAPRFGTIILPETQHSGDFGRRFASLRRQLVTLISTELPQSVWFETPIPGGRLLNTNANTLRLLSGYAAVADEVATTLGLEAREATADEWRKHFLGSARGKSKELKEAAFLKCHANGWACRNTDESDACGLWDYAIHRLRLVRRAAA